MTQQKPTELSEQDQLTLLRLTLKQHYDSGQLSFPEYTQWSAEIDAQLAQGLATRGITLDHPGWLTQREHAWRKLSQKPTQPPWAPSPITTHADVPTIPAPLHPIPKVKDTPPKAQPRGKRQEPSATEKLIGKISGWSSLTTPFLLQNIGWFIGGFSFLAGSVFLIANTAGFAKSLAVFSSLLMYSVLLLGGGYQLRKKNPGLKASSQFLFILSTLLMPLTLAAGIRMLSNADTPLTLISGSVLCVLCIGIFHYLSRLAAGVIHAKLPTAYAAWFLGLSSIQLATPLTQAFPSLLLLLLIHLGLLIALSVALRTFGRDWLQVLKEHRPYTAIFAATSLLYAGFVSFAHIQIMLPASMLVPIGYYGLLLLFVSALLFYTEHLIKQHGSGFTWINQTSFVCYASSFLALWLSWQSAFQGVTFAFAAILFFRLTWQYRTWKPFYLASGITLLEHYELILQPLPLTYYWLASLPLMLLFYAFGQTVKRSQALQQHLFYLLGGFTLSTAYLSQFAFEAGALALCHLALVTIIVFLWIQSPVTGLAQPRARFSVYHFPLHSIAGLLYLPVMAPWGTQITLGFLALSVFWLALCLRQRHCARHHSAAANLNSASVTLFAALALGFLYWPNPSLELALLCLGAAALLLLAAVGLQWPLPVYVTFAALGGSAMMIKGWAYPHYQSQTGVGITLLGLGLFALMRWLDLKIPVDKHAKLRGWR